MNNDNQLMLRLLKLRIGLSKIAEQVHWNEASSYATDLLDTDTRLANTHEPIPPQVIEDSLKSTHERIDALDKRDDYITRRVLALEEKDEPTQRRIDNTMKVVIANGEHLVALEDADLDNRLSALETQAESNQRDVQRLFDLANERDIPTGPSTVVRLFDIEARLKALGQLMDFHTVDDDDHREEHAGDDGLQTQLGSMDHRIFMLHLRIYDLEKDNEATEADSASGDTAL